MKVRAQMPPQKPMEAKRFGVGSTCEGWEVIDADGTPVSEVFFQEDLAHVAKKRLNEAALHGHKALAVALGAIDPEELEIEAMMEEI